MTPAFLVLAFLMPVVSWNSNDKLPFDFKCRTGETLSAIESHYNKEYNDRIFSFQCRDSGHQFTSCNKTNYVNHYDEFFAFQCPGHGFIIGVGSQFNENYSDRQYNFHCCEVESIVLVSCYFTKPNGYLEPFVVEIPYKHVIRSVTSVNENMFDDRQFNWDICRIQEI